MYRLGLSLGLTTGSAFPPFDPLSLSPILAFDAQKSMLASGGGAAGNLDLVATLDNRVTGGADATQTTAANQPIAHVPYGDGHLFTSGVSGNYASTPTTTDYDDLASWTAEVEVNYPQWSGAADAQTLMCKSYSWWIRLQNNGKILVVSRNAANTQYNAESSVSTGITDGTWAKIRVTRDGYDFKFYKDTGSGWVQVGTTQTAAHNTNRNNTQAVEVGAHAGGTQKLARGSFRSAKFWDSATPDSSDPILDIDFSDAEHGASSFACSTGQTITINTSGHGDPATIVRRPFLRFDGASSSGDYMQGSLASSIDTVHCIIQYRSNHTTYNTSTAGVFSVYTSEDYQSTGVRVLSGYSNNSARSYYNSGHQLIQNAKFSPDNGTVVVEASFADGAQFRKQNNASLITDSASLSLNSNKFILGDLSQTGLGYASAIDVEQIYLFDRVLSEDEATKMRNHTNPKNSIYRRITDSDALAYIATLEGDGVSVSETQKEAIEDFYVTAKSDGWYSSLRRFYLPIWGAAAPNARCLVSGTSATFIGSFTHGSGFTHPSSASTSNRFNLNYTLSDEDLTTENACLMALAYDDTAPQDRGIPTSNHTLIGAGAVTSRSIRINTKSTGLRPQAAWLGVDEDNGNMGSHGVMLANRKDGDTTLTRRNASGISDTSTTGSLTGTWNDYPIMGFGSSTGAGGGITQQTDAKAGAFGIGAGLSSTNRSSYTDAVKTLWETCSGITL